VKISSRGFAVGAALFLGAAMAVLSYDHGLITAERTGTEPPFAYVVPLLADGMFVLSTAALYDAAKGTATKRDPAKSLSQMSASRPRWAIIGLLLGGGVTVAMNLYAGWPHGWGGRLVYTMPPVFLVVAIEILVGVFRRPAIGDDSSPIDEDEPPPLEVALADLAVTYSQRQLAEALDIPRARLQRFIATTNGSGSDT
jgi:4-hydroxybenzoate polyprenyltransferase